jgi:hypothetical protein
MKPETNPTIKTYMISIRFDVPYHHMGFFQFSVIFLKDMFQAKSAFNKLFPNVKKGLMVYTQTSDLTKIPTDFITTKCKFVKQINKWIPGLVIITYDFPKTQLYLDEVHKAQDQIAESSTLVDKLTELKKQYTTKERDREEENEEEHVLSHHRVIPRGIEFLQMEKDVTKNYAHYLTYHDFVNRFSAYLLSKNPHMEPISEEEVVKTINEISTMRD